MKNIKKIILLVLSTVLLITVLSACSQGNGGNDGQTNGDSSGQSDDQVQAELGSNVEAEATGQTTSDELIIGIQSLTESVDAHGTVANDAIPVFYNIGDTLILRDTSSEQIKFDPGLAVSWEQVDDYTWDFELRQGVKFHDGTEMTAEDVQYSIMRIVNVEDPSFATAKNMLYSNIEDIEIIDDFNIRIHTIETEPLMEFLLSDHNGSIGPKAHFQEVGADGSATNAVYAGPYKVASFIPSDEIVLERFNDYWGEPAPFDKIVFKEIPEISSRLIALENNEVDMITHIPPDQQAVFEGNDSFTITNEIIPLYQTYVFNQQIPGMEDPKLRKALSLAIDRDTLNEGIWLGRADGADSYQFDYSDPYYFPEEEGVITYDPERAKELLEESSYDGQEIQIFVVADYYTYSDLTGQAVVEMWNQIGVNASMVEVDSWAALPLDEMELNMWSNTLNYPEPMGVLEEHWSPTGSPANDNKFFFTDQYAEDFKVARYSTDPEERIEALKSMYAFYDETTPFIWLFQPAEAIIHNRDITYNIPYNVRPYQIGLRQGEIEIKE